MRGLPILRTTLLFWGLCWLSCVGALNLVTPQAVSSTLFSSVAAQFGSPVPPYPGIQAQIVYSSEPTACTPLTQNVKGLIVLVDGNLNCSFSVQAMNVQNAGAAAMIVVNNVDYIPPLVINAVYYIPSMAGSGDISIVIQSIKPWEGNQLKQILANYSTVIAQVAQSPMPANQVLALMDFYTKLQGPSWSSMPGWGNSSIDPCLGGSGWLGLFCWPNGEIQGLFIDANSLSGSFPESFAALDTIQDFAITWNQALGGTLPAFFANFTRLQMLDFTGCNFGGSIPDEWEVLFQRDQLRTYFALAYQGPGLSGPVPDWVFHSTHITWIDLSYNNFNGTVSQDLTFGSSLQYIYLMNNKFTGAFPNVTGLSNLIELHLSNNQFSGSVPSFINSQSLPTLALLAMDGNKFSGDFPPEFADSTILDLDISRNNYGGVFPGANIPNGLQFLYASGNTFYSLGNTFASKLSLKSIIFEQNQFNSSLATLLGQLPIPTASQSAEGLCLMFIDFSYNQLYIDNNPLGGTLNLAAWPLLISMNLRNNSLNGTMMSGQNSNNILNVVDISHNQLTGPIDFTFGTIPNLITFNIEQNLCYTYTWQDIPWYFSTNYDVTTYFPDQNMNCPQIVTASGAIVNMDTSYSFYAPCQCETGYRRVPRTTPAQNQDGERYSVMKFQCIQCPTGMDCPGRDSDATYAIEANYYPSPSMAQPDVLITCPNCIIQNNTWGCAPWHTGRLCSKCLPGSYNRGGTCVKCAPIGAFFFIASVIILIIFAILFSMYAIFRESFCGARLAKLNTWASERAESRKRNEEYSLAALLIGINYYQTISALSEYFTLPLSVTQLLSSIRILTSLTGAGVGIECLNDNLLEYPTLYMAYLLEPVMAIAAVLVVFLVGQIMIMLRSSTPRFLHEWPITCFKLLLFILNILFFPVSSVSINAFRCTVDPATQLSYNSTYPYALCNSVTIAVRVIVFIFYGLGMVAFFSALVFQYKRNIDKSKEVNSSAYVIERAFGFFFLHFKEKYIYFAILVLMRRFLISVLVSVLPIYSAISFALNSCVLIGSVLVVLYVRPFRTKVDNNLEVATTACCSLVYGLALVMSLDQFSYGAVIAEAIYFVINGLVLATCAFEFFRGNLPFILQLLNRGKSMQSVGSEPSSPSEMMPRHRLASSTGSESVDL